MSFISQSEQLGLFTWGWLANREPAVDGKRACSNIVGVAVSLVRWQPATHPRSLCSLRDTASQPSIVSRGCADQSAQLEFDCKLSGVQDTFVYFFSREWKKAGMKGEGDQKSAANVKRSPLKWISSSSQSWSGLPVPSTASSCGCCVKISDPGRQQFGVRKLKTRSEYNHCASLLMLFLDCGRSESSLHFQTHNLTSEQQYIADHDAESKPRTSHHNHAQHQR